MYLPNDLLPGLLRANSIPVIEVKKNTTIVADKYIIRRFGGLLCEVMEIE